MDQWTYINNITQWSSRIEDIRSRLDAKKRALQNARSFSVGAETINQIASDIVQLESELNDAENDVIATQVYYDKFTWVADSWDYNLESIYKNKTATINSIMDWVRQYYNNSRRETEEDINKATGAIAQARANEAALANINANRMWASIQWGQEQQNINFLRTQEALAQMWIQKRAELNNLGEQELTKQLNLTQMNSADVDNYLRPIGTTLLESNGVSRYTPASSSYSTNSNTWSQNNSSYKNNSSPSNNSWNNNNWNNNWSNSQTWNNQSTPSWWWGWWSWGNTSSWNYSPEVASYIARQNWIIPSSVADVVTNNIWNKALWWLGIVAPSKKKTDDERFREAQKKLREMEFWNSPIANPFISKPVDSILNP